jgi:hypothetical protein
LRQHLQASRNGEKIGASRKALILFGLGSWGLDPIADICKIAAYKRQQQQRKKTMNSFDEQQCEEFYPLCEVCEGCGCNIEWENQAENFREEFSEEELLCGDCVENQEWEDRKNAAGLL